MMKTFFLLLLLSLASASQAQNDPEFSKRFKAAEKWEKQAEKKANHGNVDSMLSLGKFYLSASQYAYGFTDRSMATIYLEMAYAKKNAEAGYLLGRLYAHPVLCLNLKHIKEDPDYNKALDYFAKSGDRGSTEAMFEMLQLMKKMLTKEKDTALINQLYAYIIDKKDQLSPETLNMLNLAKDHPMEKAAAAFKLMKYQSAMDYWMAAYLINYDGIAAYNIATMYLSGKGVTQSNTDAAAWFAESGDLGFARGSFMAGEMFWTKSLGKSNEWYEKAIAQGFPDFELAKKRIRETNALVANYELAQHIQWEKDMETIRRANDAAKSRPALQAPAQNVPVKIQPDPDREMYDRMHQEAKQREIYYKNKWGW